MLDGRQTVLLRKGGIHEKRFDVAASEFVFFPTVAHGHAERVRPEHRDLLDAGRHRTAPRTRWSSGRARKWLPPLRSTGPRGSTTLADTHIWTAESVRADRLDFRPKHRLTVLVVQARPLLEPVRLRAGPDLRGVQELGRAAGDRASWADPVHDDATLAAIAERVRGVSRLTAAAVRPAAPAATARPRRGGRCAWRVAIVVPEIGGSSVPRLRTKRGCEPPATMHPQPGAGRESVRDGVEFESDDAGIGVSA